MGVTSALALAVALTVALTVAPAVAATPDTTPDPTLDTTLGTTSSTVAEIPVATTVPPGCPLPPSATAVFVGEVTASDVRTARLRVLQVRAGSLQGHQVGDLVDVDYGDEVRFLDVGQTYLVGVADDDLSGRLSSSVREPAPLFGGNQVAGLDDTAGDCPTVENPIRTLMPDGTPVESGVLAPMLEDSDGLLAALVLPAVWVFLGLLALAAVKNLLWASGREMRGLARGRQTARRR